MQSIFLDKNLSLFEDAVTIVVGTYSQQSNIIDKILGASKYEKIIFDKKLTAKALKTFFDSFDGEPRKIVVLKGCFSGKDRDKMYLDGVDQLFRYSKSMGLSLIVGIDRMNLPHTYYTCSDFIVIHNPVNYTDSIISHLAEDPRPNYIELINSDLSLVNHVLFVDNRVFTQENNSNDRYFKLRGAETEDKKSGTTGATTTQEIQLSDEDTCCICLVEYENDDVVMQCRKCRNYSHHKCLKDWYVEHTSCPLCRKEGVPKRPRKLKVLVSENSANSV